VGGAPGFVETATEKIEQLDRVWTDQRQRQTYRNGERRPNFFT